MILAIIHQHWLQTYHHFSHGEKSDKSAYTFFIYIFPIGKMYIKQSMLLWGKNRVILIVNS